MLNHVDIQKVETVRYPVMLDGLAKAPYFEKREEWKVTDLLKNPMVELSSLTGVNDARWQCVH